MDLQLYLISNIRINFLGDLNWFLFSILKRLKRNFKFCKRIVEFYFKKKKPYLKHFYIEPLKFKTQINRDILILSLFKYEAFCTDLWIQFLLDNFVLCDKINILLSSLIFFPKVNFFLNCTKLILGIEGTLIKNTNFNVKKFLLLLLTSPFNFNDIIKKDKFSPIIKKIFGFYSWHFFNFFKFNILIWFKKISKSYIFGNFLLLSNQNTFGRNKKKTNVFCYKNNKFYSLKFMCYRNFKLRRKCDQNIIFILMKRFLLFFNFKKTSNFWTETTFHNDRFWINLIFPKKIKFFYRFRCLEKNFNNNFILFSKRFKIILLTYEFKKKKFQFPGSFFPLISNIGLFEGGRKSYGSKFTYFKPLFLSLNLTKSLFLLFC
jgi:hypothetical protein